MGPLQVPRTTHYQIRSALPLQSRFFPPSRVPRRPESASGRSSTPENADPHGVSGIRGIFNLPTRVNNLNMLPTPPSPPVVVPIFANSGSLVSHPPIVITAALSQYLLTFSGTVSWACLKTSSTQLTNFCSRAPDGRCVLPSNCTFGPS